MSRERKIYVAVLSLGLLALGVDQFLLRGGGEASSEPAQQEAGAVGPRAAAGSTEDVTAETEALLERIDLSDGALREGDPLAERLTELAERRGYDVPNVTDAFRPPEQWSIAEGEDDDAETEEPPTAAERFRSKHRLLAVMTATDGGVAVLNQQRRPVEVGESIDGFRLIAVTDSAARFQSGQATVTLELDRPGGADQPPASPPAPSIRNTGEGGP